MRSSLIVPVLLLAPLAGSLVDRLPRVRVMVGADLVRMLLAGGLAVWHGSPPIVYAVAAGLACGQVFFAPAAQSLLPSLVDRDELIAANSGIWTAAVTAQVLVAPLAALLAARVGCGAAFAANAVSFAVSAAVLGSLREPDRPETGTGWPHWPRCRFCGSWLSGSSSRRCRPAPRAHCSSCSLSSGSAAEQPSDGWSPESASARQLVHR